MSSMISVRPAPGRLRDFARWAVAQDPKIRTSGPREFAVPCDLFAKAPEEILIGALVEGHRYASPVEDAALGRQAPGATGTAPDPGGETDTARGFHAAVPGEPLPEVPAAACGPDSSLLPDPSEAGAPGARRDEAPEGVFPCSSCEREFTTERGRDTHRRHKHAEA